MNVNSSRVVKLCPDGLKWVCMEKSRVIVRDIATSEVLVSFPSTEGVDTLEWSPDCDLILVGSNKRADIQVA